jgi:hypothetical protein
MTARVGASVALLAGILGGWLWGASGRGELARALRAAELRNEVMEARSNVIQARAAVLGARVNLCDADYAGMGRQLEKARTLIASAGARLNALGMSDEPRRPDLGGFNDEIDRAQYLATSLALPAGISRQSAWAYVPNWLPKTDWNIEVEANRRSSAAFRSRSASQGVQRTAKGNARSRGSAISPAHSAQ